MNIKIQLNWWHGLVFLGAGCSTVLIPARVVQALKLHSEKMGSESRSNRASFPVQQGTFPFHQTAVRSTFSPEQQRPKVVSLAYLKDNSIGIFYIWSIHVLFCRCLTGWCEVWSAIPEKEPVQDDAGKEPRDGSASGMDILTWSKPQNGLFLTTTKLSLTLMMFLLKKRWRVAE